MRNFNKKTLNKKPWNNIVYSKLPKPTEKVRENIYAFARENIITQQKKKSNVKQFVVSLLHNQYSYALWSAAAAILIFLCVWLGNHDNYESNIYAQNKMENVADEIEFILNTENFFLLSEQSEVDIDDVTLFVEIQTINEGLKTIENELQLN